MSRRTKHEVARERFEIARMELQTKRMTRILANYDATDTSKARRQAVPERLDEGGIYSQSRRLKGVAIGRDIERNYSPGKSLLHQLRVNVVGSLGKLKVNLADDGGKEAADWFNEVWSKDCDFRDDCDWSTMLQNITATVPREGDCLAVFDDDLIEDSGKLLMFESDQIGTVDEDVLKASKYGSTAGVQQDNGIIRDKWGRVLAYTTTNKHGLYSISASDNPTFWARDEAARLITNPWRLNQGRGVPSIITSANNFIDLYDILSSELMSAKRAAKQYAYVRRRDGVTDWDDPGSAPEFLAENSGQNAATVATQGANESTDTGAKNYEKIEAMTGGLTDYIDPQDEVMIPDLKHPNPQLAAFLEAVQGYGGAAMGIARAYTVLRADSSYTAFRGDMIMTWVTFYWLQKWLERRACDWIARKALGWAQRKSEIKALPVNWERSLSWTWPRMPEVDQLDAENAIAAALKNGTTDFSELLGPDWKRRMKGYAEQVNTIKELGLPLGILEMKSGGTANAKKDSTTQKEEGAV